MSSSQRHRAAPAQAAAVRPAHADRTLSPSRARSLAARALDDAMDALGATNEGIGDAIGCDEAIVRRMRQGARPITAERILRLPAALRVEYLARLAAAADAPPCAARREATAPTPDEARGEVFAALVAEPRGPWCTVFVDPRAPWQRMWRVTPDTLRPQVFATRWGDA